MREKRREIDTGLEIVVAGGALVEGLRARIGNQVKGYRNGSHKINTGKRIPPPAPLLAFPHCTRNNVASLFFISVMMTPTESPFFLFAGTFLFYLWQHLMTISKRYGHVNFPGLSPVAIIFL
jgi:hypothetical protein